MKDSNFLDRLIDNPKTDLATILMIYWKSIPNKDSKYKQIIEERYNNYYNDQKIAFNPQDDRGANWIHELSMYGDSIETIPKIMPQKLNGKELDTHEGWFEGLPAELNNEISELYDDLDE